MQVLDRPKSAAAECACCAPAASKSPVLTVPTAFPAGLVTLEPMDAAIPRRRFIGGAVAAVAAGTFLAACGPGDEEDASSPSAGDGGAGPAAKLKRIELAFCSQVLCVLPYEVAARQGFFEEQGYEVNLTYMKGGALAMNALLGGSVDWVGTPMDLVVAAWGAGKQVRMVASTSSLPFFALVAGPDSGIESIADLAGRSVGVGNLNTTDHLMMRFLLAEHGVPEGEVDFVPLGPNLYDGLVRGQVDAGMVQEPSLTLLQREGGTVLVNFMKQEDVRQVLGGGYQFMGLNTRADVLEREPDTARRLAAALVRANRWIREHSGAEIVENLPRDLIAGGNVEIFAAALDQFKDDLYPADGRIDPGAVERVIQVQQLSGALQQEVPLESVFTNDFLDAAG